MKNKIKILKMSMLFACAYSTAVSFVQASSDSINLELDISAASQISINITNLSGNDITSLGFVNVAYNDVLISNPIKVNYSGVTSNFSISVYTDSSAYNVPLSDGVPSNLTYSGIGDLEGGDIGITVENFSGATGLLLHNDDGSLKLKDLEYIGETNKVVNNKRVLLMAKNRPIRIPLKFNVYAYKKPDDSTVAAPAFPLGANDSLGDYGESRNWYWVAEDSILPKTVTDSGKIYYELDTNNNLIFDGGINPKSSVEAKNEEGGSGSFQVKFLTDTNTPNLGIYKNQIYVELSYN